MSIIIYPFLDTSTAMRLCFGTVFSPDASFLYLHHRNIYIYTYIICSKSVLRTVWDFLFTAKQHGIREIRNCFFWNARFFVLYTKTFESSETGVTPLKARDLMGISSQSDLMLVTPSRRYSQKRAIFSPIYIYFS